MFSYTDDVPRPRTEDELTVMQVMIANTQAALATAELLYAEVAKK